MMHDNRKDLTGQRFGRLVVIEPVTTGEYRNSVWLCQCDCGNKKIVPTYRLLNGRTYSCGCYRKQAKQVIEELAKVKTENERLKEGNEELKKENNKYNGFCVEANAQISELTQIIFSTYKLLISDFDNLKGKILTEKDMEYIEKRNQSISQCLKQLNEVLKDE